MAKKRRGADRRRRQAQGDLPDRGQGRGPASGSANTTGTSSIADLVAQLEPRLQPTDAVLRGDAALRRALLQHDRATLRARLDELAGVLVLPAEHLQVCLTTALAAEAVSRLGVEAPPLDHDRARAAGREHLENIAFACVELEARERAALIEQATATHGAPARIH